MYLVSAARLSMRSQVPQLSHGGVVPSTTSSQQLPRVLPILTDLMGAYSHVVPQDTQSKDGARESVAAIERITASQARQRLVLEFYSPESSAAASFEPAHRAMCTYQGELRCSRREGSGGGRGVRMVGEVGRWGAYKEDIGRSDVEAGLAQVYKSVQCHLER